MEEQQMLQVLRQVANRELSPEQAQKALADEGFADLGFAKVDTDLSLIHI